MAYTFTNASLSAFGKQPKDTYIDLFKATLEAGFYNASDWWTIQEEYPRTSQDYQNVDVRITHVINAETGVKLGDDWKSILFKEVEHSTSLGNFYQFDSNIWLVINTEVVKNLAATATLKRCNNVLRWVDVGTGHFYSEPCSIDYLIKEPRDYATAGSAWVTPSGYLQIRTQFNERTNLIKPNQRFLFGNPGNWTAYKVVGTGANNFNNQETFDNLSTGILWIEVVANYVNYDTDDLVNGIADVEQNIYSLTLDKASLTGSIGKQTTLEPTLLYNGNTTTRDLEWSSSNSSVATVSDGVVSFVGAGNATITVSIVGNPLSTTCSVTVSGAVVSNSRVVISPNQNYVLEGLTETFAVHLYVDDVQQGDTFTITCNGNGIPSSQYLFTQTDGNHFSIQNLKMFLTANLSITATSGTETAIYSITLKGKW